MIDHKKLAKELRSGNYLLGKPISITRLGLYGDGTSSISAHGIDLMERGMDSDLKPLPITTELLIKCGFTKDNMNGAYIELNHACHSKFKSLSLAYNNDDSRDQYYVFYREGNSDNRVEDDVVVLRNDLRYMHELQNLFQGITGAELQIDFSK